MSTKFKLAEQIVRDIRQDIIALGPDRAEACFELAQHISRLARVAGPVVGNMAIALAGAEGQLVVMAMQLEKTP